MVSPGLISENKVVVVDILKLRNEYGISVGELIELLKLGVFPQLNVYQVLDKKEALEALAEYSK